jgi:dihydrofolate synthase/folylpolyglutamate synthase
MRIEQITAFLFSLNPKGIRFGLENTRLVLEQLGRPQDGYRCVHLAGSNGKGSTAAFIEAVMRQAGVRTGLYTSPHLNHFRERFRVDGQPVSDDAICAAADRFFKDGLQVDPAEVAAWIDEHDMVRRMRSGSWYSERGEGSDFCRLTFFECTTVLSLLLFEVAGIDLAIVETGMGGRLDATNVLMPQVAAITPIHLEHTAWLGDTITAIAGEKAGIIKAGVPVVIGRQHPDAKEVLARVADEQASPAQWLGQDFDCAGDWQQARFEVGGQTFGPVRLGLAGAHQRDNAALALACLPHLGAELWPARPEWVETGLSTVHWPGRFERFGASGQWILDGAHNPDGAVALAQVVRDSLGSRPVRLVFGVLGDKEASHMLGQLEPLASSLTLVRPADSRGRDPADLRGLADGSAEVIDSVGSALEQLSRQEGDPILVCGSLTVVGEARAWLLERGERPLLGSP